VEETGPGRIDGSLLIRHDVWFEWSVEVLHLGVSIDSSLV
jgi:hypothetical protein